MSVPSAVDMPVTALFAEAEGDKSSDKKSQCLGYIPRSSGRVNPVVYPDFFFFVQQFSSKAKEHFD